MSLIGWIKKKFHKCEIEAVESLRWRGCSFFTYHRIIVYRCRCGYTCYSNRVGMYSYSGSMDCYKPKSKNYIDGGSFDRVTQDNDLDAVKPMLGKYFTVIGSTVRGAEID